MTDILDKNTLILTFYGCLEAKWYKQSNKNMFFDSECWNLKMASKMAVSKVPKTYLTKKTRYKAFQFWLFIDV